MSYLRYIHLALLTLLLLPSLAAANVVITEVLADPPGLTPIATVSTTHMKTSSSNSTTPAHVASP